MRVSGVAACLCLGLLTGSAMADGPLDLSRRQARAEIPPVVFQGLEAYRSKGVDDAIKAWVEASPLDGSKAAANQSNNLHQAENYYGAYRTFDVVSIQDLSRKTRIIYLVLDYEKGPLFGKFVAYQTDQRWILTSFEFNTDEDKILPEVVDQPCAPAPAPPSE